MNRFLLLPVVAALTGCGSGGSNSTTNSKPPTPQPTVVNLYPVGYATNPRIFVMITNVGSVSTSLPLAFDTGSAGMTMNALSLFPSSIVTASGFNFAGGESSITYNGITVTPVQGRRSYGGSNGRTQIGNLGFAEISFGEGDGVLTTAVMPVLFYYSVIENATGLPAPSDPQQGMFGVDAAPNLIVVAGSTEPPGGYPACTTETTISCFVISVFKYLSYGKGLDAGFMLSPASLQQCDITTIGSCSPQPILSVRLNAALESGFSTFSLTCSPPGYLGPDTINGYPACYAWIPNTTITVSGAATATINNQTVLFDTGNPTMALYEPPGISLPSPLPVGSSVLVDLPSGYSYSYDAGASGITLTTTGADVSNVIGIDFFTGHSLFIDFSTGIEGWK